MNFEKFFKFISYAAAFCGFLALSVSGSFGVIGTTLFVGAMAAAWFLEGSRWQISERLGTALIVLALPAFYLLWKFNLILLSGTETLIAGVLARLILTLTAIKLLQKKSDRDWIFLYLMAFFEVLLAAGLSISALYLASFVLYLLVMVCAVIAFEMRKTSRAVAAKMAVPLNELDAEGENLLPVRRLPSTAIVLIILIICMGVPLFFFLPRVGGAGFGGSSPGIETRSGFSDTVRLGGIGTIQQNDAVVMRVRLEGADGEQGNLYWRGLALDTFDGLSWKRSNLSKEPLVRGDGEMIRVDFASSRDNLAVQTIYLEPLDTPVLFGLSRIVALRSNLPLIYKDRDGGITSTRLAERISYRVWSDRSLPPVDRLRSDNEQYSPDLSDYLELPDDIDERIAGLTSQIVEGKDGRYEKARAVEQYLQNNLGYTLEMKAGGKQPLSDFLFNVREGHCEYFATAMAVMLRTQGIATRVVNGFHQGDYIDTADIYVVRQKNAHSWVEVYFPKENAWVPFDPTPVAGQVAPGWSSGIAGRFNKYVEALEAFWIQYFVAYDNQEQRTLVRSVRSGFMDYQTKTTSFLGHAQDVIRGWWAEVRGDKGFQTSVSAILYAAGYFVAAVLGLLLFVWLYRKVVKSKVWGGIADWLSRKKRPSVVEFYDRMQRVLASKGLRREPHQTPLEFAFAVDMPEAVKITEKYNRVRFGEKNLSTAEANEIENWLNEIAIGETPRRGERSEN